ncbi:MAG: response regulator [Thermodesulfobacteriota bacterium]|nr:response regulator [Thermodesulfobacteriota bacterium]
MEKKKILAVDNNTIILKFMTDLLVKKGYRVLTAKDGLLALDILKNYTPDVIFIDLIMPNINGAKLCKIIRGMPNLKNVYIVILSAAAMESQENFTEFGANACIAKSQFKIMGRHILNVLDSLDQATHDKSAKEIIGLKNISSREITRELLADKEHFEAILGNISDGVLEITSDARIVYANDSALSLIGDSEEKVIALNFVELFYENDRKRIKDLLENLDGVPQIISEDSPLTVNGKQIVLNFLPIKDKKQETILVIIRDVSEKKHRELQLIQTEKIESVGILAGGIAHDFNNILTGILGNVSLAKVYAKPEDKVFEKLMTAEKGIFRAKELTRQLLTFARGGSPIKKPILISDLLKNSVTFALTGSKARCEFSISDDLWPVEVDEEQLKQAIENLIINADQAMSEGGIIHVLVESIIQRVKDVLPLQEGKYIKITIRDQGSGIPKEHLPKIFDLYFTTKQQGSGLGLATVYSIIKNHNGYITVESELGVGTTFYIYLPISKREIIAKKERKESPLAGKGRVLLMDDEEMIRESVGEMIMSLGYKVEFAKDGAEAIEEYKKARRSGQAFDVVIMDLTIPGGMGGKEAIKKFLEIDPEIKAIVSSGYSNDPIMANFTRYGFKGVLTKPFQISELNDEIHRVLISTKVPGES